MAANRSVKLRVASEGDGPSCNLEETDADVEFHLLVELRAQQDMVLRSNNHLLITASHLKDKASQ